MVAGRSYCFQTAVTGSLSDYYYQSNPQAASQRCELQEKFGSAAKHPDHY